jgi:hypothetical protein
MASAAASTRAASAHAEILASLASDPDESVSVEALDALSWLAVQLGSPNHGVTMSEPVERAAVAASHASSWEVRGSALNTMWRLVVENMRPLSPALRTAFATLMIDDPDARLRGFALYHFDALFDASLRSVVLVILVDVGKPPDIRDLEKDLRAARAALGGRPSEVKEFLQAQSTSP